MRLGLLVNPIAGLGGPAGLKGSDTGWRQALEQGVLPQAPGRAARFVAALQASGARISFVTPPGSMGIDMAPPAERVLPDEAFAFGSTTPEDTRRAAAALAGAGIDLLCFVGGDGTATDVAAAVGVRVPCLGVPAGVKVTSPVFAHDPEEAAHLVATLPDRFDTVERDVTDLDEVAYRQDRLDVRLTGALRVPVGPAVQAGKVATVRDTPLDGIVDMVLTKWDPDALWLIGAGSVCRAVKRRFYGEPTLLGVDVVLGDRIIAKDIDAARARELVGGQPTRILLSPIGGQGILLGRGTQVLPPDVLGAVGWSRIMVAAPPEKLAGIRGLWVDSGDPAFDAASPRHVRVIVGWNESRVVRLLHGHVPEP